MFVSANSRSVTAGDTTEKTHSKLLAKEMKCSTPGFVARKAEQKERLVIQCGPITLAAIEF